MFNLNSQSKIYKTKYVGKMLCEIYFYFVPITQNFT